MKKIFTQKKTVKKEEMVVAPSERTLDFLKQFARTYYIDKSLPRQVNSLCTN